jgi:hypothetical protein
MRTTSAESPAARLRPRGTRGLQSQRDDRERRARAGASLGAVVPIDEIIRAAGGPAVATVITAILGAIAPVTVWIHNRAKLRLQERADEQKLKLREQAQEHKIVTGYLDRALDPTVPLAIRQQLLRFLSTSAKDGRQLETWAAAELKRVDAVVEGLDRGVVEAERALHAAKTAQAVKEAEARLAAAVKRKRTALEPAVRPPPTAAALKAGLYSGSKGSLVGIDMHGQDLAGAELLLTNLRGANFREADLTRAHFGDADVRGADFSSAKLRRRHNVARRLRSRRSGSSSRGRERTGARSRRCAGSRDAAACAGRGRPNQRERRRIALTRPSPMVMASHALPARVGCPTMRWPAATAAATTARLDT